jgi:hypothetical protein
MYLLANGLDLTDILATADNLADLDFSLVGVSWSVWIKLDKPICLATVNLVYCDTSSWSGVAKEVRRELLDYEYCGGDRFVDFCRGLGSPVVCIGD